MRCGRSTAGSLLTHTQTCGCACRDKEEVSIAESWGASLGSTPPPHRGKGMVSVHPSAHPPPCALLPGQPSLGAHCAGPAAEAWLLSPEVAGKRSRWHPEGCAGRRPALQQGPLPEAPPEAASQDFSPCWSAWSTARPLLVQPLRSRCHPTTPVALPGPSPLQLT